MDLNQGSEYLWHGVTWATGVPTLLLADVSTRTLVQVDLIGLEIGLKAVGPTRYCTGRYGFSDTINVHALPCPQQTVPVSGGQCATCLEQDEFRFAHQVHKGGHVPPALAAYMAQPHWLYVATFAHASSKVGTAAAPRRKSRLDEQGPMLATYLAETSDGRAVRHLEDALSNDLDLAQTVRSIAKLTALVSPDPSSIRTAHEAIAHRAVATLIQLGVDISRQDWAPPPEGFSLWSRPQDEDRVLYPHDLREGEHGFRIEACAGTLILARLTTGADNVRYVLDLNALKGRRVSFGDYASPETALQSSLF